MNGDKLLSPLEAGAVFRSEKLRDFQAEAQDLCFTDAAVLELLQRIQDLTAEVDTLDEQQQVLPKPWHLNKDGRRDAPWWADGEYDQQKADRANARGTQQYKAKAFREAFSSFTDAIRLHPPSAVYHCNRAKTALKLGLHDIAAGDSGHALQRDPGYLAAHLAAGDAALGLSDCRAAELHFGNALALDAASSGAKRGLQRAKAMQEAASKSVPSSGGSDGTVERPRLPLIPDSSDPAELLLSLESTLRASPGLLSAKLARIESLILCQRFEDARHWCAELPESVDSLYLDAEALWRDGRLVPAQTSLARALQLNGDSPKCQALSQLIDRLAELWHCAEAALEEGGYASCVEACSSGLISLSPEMCPGLVAQFLHLRARAQEGRGRFQEALTDLEAAVAADPQSSDALLLKAQVQKALGHFIESFLTLQELQQAAPDTPNLLGLMSDAAAKCSSQSRPQEGCGGRGEAGGPLEVLGLRVGCTSEETRSAYRRLASKWHPDKWMQAPSEARADAARQFDRVQAAFGRLCDD